MTKKASEMTLNQLEEIIKNDPASMTTEMLEALLAKRKESEKKAKEKAREQYESERDQLVNLLVDQAVQIRDEMNVFKDHSFTALEQFRSMLMEYGDISKNSKGGFQLVSQDGTKRLKYGFRQLSFWDERAAKAEVILKEFLADTIKKKDQTLHDIILGLLEKNKEGHLEFRRIATLYKYEDSYQDERWKEALRLFKESFQAGASKFDLYFQEKDAKGEWQTINLTFNSL